MKTIITIFVLQLLLLGCSKNKVEDPPTTSSDACTTSGFTTASEASLCSTNYTHSSPVTVSGTATFYKRDIEMAGVTPASGLRLGGFIPTALPIRFAEVQVVNASGAVVQCGKTNSSGQLKALDGVSALQIPSAAGNYTVQVYSRANHAMDVTGSPGKPAFQLLASVKNVCNNVVHSAASTVASPGSGTITANLVAQANEALDSNISGGAFNIYNDLVSTYEYLAQNTGTSNLSCLSPKLDVFWSPGYNPAQLLYPDTNPSQVSNISFYLRGYNELYINGGKLGNVSTEDTDHFDDAVIVHEIGHRIEDVCGKMDSPGGTHYGLFRIDPRLAWSEGWGNFLGGHIVRNKTANINPNLGVTLAAHDNWLYYLDTKGYHDGAVTAGTTLIQLDLAKAGNNPEKSGNCNSATDSNCFDNEAVGNGGYYYDKVDATNFPGEGHFREVSVARSLFKTTNTCVAAGCTDDNSNFAPMWKAFEKDTSGIGMGKVDYPFRSSVRFYSRMKAVMTTLPAGVQTILDTDEAMQIDGSASYSASGTTLWSPYGIKLVGSGITVGGSPCPMKIQPRREYSNIAGLEADQRYSSHFFYFDRNQLPSVTSITLNATKSSGTNVDIDLILFQEGYQFPTETCTTTDGAGNCTAYTKNTTSTQFIRSDRSIAATPGTSFSKTVSSLNVLSSSVAYLLNVKAYTALAAIADTTEYTYNLRSQTGEYLCPSGTF